MFQGAKESMLTKIKLSSSFRQAPRMYLDNIYLQNSVTYITQMLANSGVDSKSLNNLASTLLRPKKNLNLEILPI
jgi:hypothetical protein